MWLYWRLFLSGLGIEFPWDIYDRFVEVLRGFEGRFDRLVFLGNSGTQPASWQRPPVRSTRSTRARGRAPSTVRVAMRSVSPA